MKNTYFIIIVIFGIAIFILVIFLFKDKSDKAVYKNEEVKVMPTLLGPQTNNEGGVTVVVMPKDNSAESFEMILDTHSRDLGEDLTQISVLLDERGNEYKPLSWEGDPPGGHHRKGILKFKPIAPQPKSITLKIKNLGGIKERTFSWQLK